MRAALLALPILAGVLWGTVGVFVRWLSADGMDSYTIVFVRVLFSALMMLALILAADRKLLRLKPRDVWLMVACGLSMVGLNLFYTMSIDRMSLSFAAVLLSLSPVFMLLMAAVAFGERVTGRKTLCMAVSVAGCVLVSGVLEDGGDVSASGVAAGLAAAFFYALYGILSKRAGAGGYSTYTILFYGLVVSTVAMLPLADLGSVSSYVSGGIGNVAFLLLHSALATFLPYILYTTAMVRAEAGTSSLLAACGEPVAAAVFGLMLFSEVPSPAMVLGMVMAIGAMAVMCMPSKHQKVAPEGA